MQAASPSTLTRRHTGAPLRTLIALLALLALSAAGHAGTAQAASRSTRVHFFNNSDADLHRAGGEIDHGCWAESLKPPEEIPSGAEVEFEAESCGIAPGDEFHVQYELNNKTKLLLAYDNPFIGSNSYEETAPDGYAISRSGGSGNNAVVSQVFTCSSAGCDGIPNEWK